MGGDQLPLKVRKAAPSKHLTCASNINKFHPKDKIVTLFRSTIMFYGTDNILWNILHIQVKCGEYFVENCQSHITLLWV
jgi:hypothetical protein